MKSALIVGAGFSGAVLARQLALAGISVVVIDERNHVGGNCHTYRDPATGVMVHAHGPHIFHTSNDLVWNYIQQFGEWVPYVNRVKANTGEGVFSLPINLHTINQYYNRTFSPQEAKAFINHISDKSINTPANLEEQALKFIGKELYEAFFKNYTIKQWGCDPTKLPPHILKRLPIRFNYNDSYYDSTYQAMPRDGYTRIIESILDHPLILVNLNTPWDHSRRSEERHVFYSGALDQYFNYCEGRLGYRTVYWQQEISDGDFQGNAVINYTNLADPFTRVIEHKHFAPWETHSKTLVCREFSKDTDLCDIPYYPKRLEGDLSILKKYVDMANREQNISFIGRLGTYSYIDMHQVIYDALTFSNSCLLAVANEDVIPKFSRAPL